MGTILVGTASWTDKTLIDSKAFYPAEAKSPEARLRYYASRFPLVEIDATYYALPAERTAQMWAERTPDGFTFNVKAFRLFTGHQAQLRALPADIRTALQPGAPDKFYLRDLSPEIQHELWRRFRLGLEPLRASGKLGAVLLQYAPWFVFGRESFEFIEHCAHMLEGYRLAVEFRNKSWFGEKTRERVLAFERERELVHVVVDEPQGFASSIPQVWEVTCPELVVFRLHGHNREMWTKKGLATSAERFNYLYSTAQLNELIEPVQELARKAKRVHVLFNNCHGDKAQRNATEFRELLTRLAA
ncbi:MAG TPA: DUF72 domain-containing protein [Burkholderiaceae bacterium]|nr:DUF72 domain-containing protein [Burkholderiaceae bacterium]